MRVGVLFEYGSLNGGEFSMLAMLDHISRSVIQAVALCPDEGPLKEELIRREIPVFPWPKSVSGAWSDEDRRQQAQFLNQVIQDQKLHLLHANSLTMARRLGQISENLNCPATGHLRDMMSLSRSGIEGLSRLHRLAAVSEATRLDHIGQGLPEAKIKTIYNGVDLDRFRPLPPTGFLKAELGIPQQSHLAAVIGQICLRKGQDDFAAAAVLLKDEFPNLHFVMIGQRHSRKLESVQFDAAITERFQSAGLSHRLHRLEFRNDIPDLLREIDVLVHPARQEPLGRVLLEAAACGKPIMATNVGGTREILKHQQTALLVPPGRPEELSQGISFLLKNPQTAKHYGESAAIDIARRFPAQMAAQNMLMFWQQSEQ